MVNLKEYLKLFDESTYVLCWARKDEELKGLGDRLIGSY